MWWLAHLSINLALNIGDCISLINRRINMGFKIPTEDDKQPGTDCLQCQHRTVGLA